MKEQLKDSIQVLVEKYQDIALLWETAYRQTEGYLLLAILCIVIVTLLSLIFLWLIFFYRRHNRKQLDEIRKQTTWILRGNNW